MVSVWRNIVSRSFVAEAAIAPKSQSYAFGLTTHKAKISRENGVTIALTENNSPVSSISFLFKSGPRYEDNSNLGISHELRALFAHATRNYSTMGVTRHLMQLGANFSCSTGREHMAFNLSILRDHSHDGFNILSECATREAFKHWEVDKLRTLFAQNILGHSDFFGDYAVDAFETEAAARDAETKVFDMLHEAAFRNGLGNSIFMPDHRNGKYSCEELERYLRNTRSLEGMVIVGSGVSPFLVQNFVKKLDHISPEHIPPTPTKYYGGGNVRKDVGGQFAHVAVAGAGAKLGSPEAASLAVAANILSSGHGLKNSPNTINNIDKLHTALASVGGTGHVVPLNVNYSDAGLFGFQLVEEAAKAGESVRAIANYIKTIQVTEEDVKLGILQTKSKLLMDEQSDEYCMEDMGMQYLLLGDYKLANCSVYDNVTVASVQSAISSMLKSKPSVAAFGNIFAVPYADEL